MIKLETGLGVVWMTLLSSGTSESGHDPHVSREDT